ncbi:serine/threonine-protein kinase DCLK3 [Pleurodeles waltl]|uniref:serine/threonine-protein kinase DCLK3 n=1 Tax=Pleurodeles waltl TaxID=8319 RepID=UPI003709598B
MPALQRGAEEALPCACRHQMGQPPISDQPSNSFSPRKPDRVWQGTYPPVGRGCFGKPFLAMNTYSSPFFSSRNGFHTIHSENSPVKPKIVTVVKPGNCTLRKITLLLNRRSVQTFEQLIADISEALGLPRWKNDRVRKLYTIKGKEIGGISDFFRGDDVFIAMGREQLTTKNIETVIEELYPDSLSAHATGKGHCELSERTLGETVDQTLNADSGFEESKIPKVCCGAKSPRLATKHDEKTECKTRHTETVRMKKWEREKWHRDQGRPPEKLREGPKYPKKDTNIKDRIADVNLNDIVQCEQCRKQRQGRRKLHHERQVCVSLDVKHPNLGSCQRYSLERKTHITSCGTFSRSAIGGHESECIGKDCTHHHKHIYSNFNEINKRQDITENQRDISLDQNELHYRQFVPVKHLAFDPQYGINQDRSEDRKKKGSVCMLRESCRISEDCHVHEEKQIKTHMEGNVQDTKQLSRTVNTETDLERAQENGGLSATTETKEFNQLSDREPKHLRCRADVEHYYEIGRTIGDGNFAIVKECRVRSVNQHYAMKIIDKSKLKGKEDMIENEISIIKDLSHPNIVKLLDEYETETEIYLIMEYVKGGDLFDAIIESVRFTEHDAALMIADLCEALVYIHCKNIVHRDLKPENLLIQHNPDKSTTLKLADFGLAVHVTGPIFTVCGTPTYVAPEILLENGYGLEVDLWATGVILYILLCGFPPFRSQERDQEELFQIIQNGHYEFTSPYWDKISDAAKDLISKLLVVDPKTRFTASQALQHRWISSDGKRNSRNLQREVTMNIERHFQSRRRQEASTSDR